jgi:hypothetical protein
VERKMLPWSFVFDQALYELSRFSQHLRADDRAVFDDLITQCKLYAPVGEVLPSPERKMSLLFWIIFAQHKKLMELQKQVDEPGGVRGSPGELEILAGVSGKS